jgi:hypothetical protein
MTSEKVKDNDDDAKKPPHPLWGKILSWTLPTILEQYRKHKTTPCFLVMCKHEKEYQHPESWLFQDEKINLTQWRHQEEKKGFWSAQASLPDGNVVHCNFLLVVATFQLPGKVELPPENQIIFLANRWLTSSAVKDSQATMDLVRKTKHLPLVFWISQLDDIIIRQLQQLIFS